ncbi:hypothetical protein ACQP2F_42750 [Actinoplanes sp. CA-030573]|uniref:hypothetical protein n=1 Tax=Actinoplanes sp. CA-030573 TaxID=3239898 RepID=UPI003D8A7101
MRAFLGVDDLGGLVREVFGSDRRPVALDRLTGGTKKGVYRLRLDDATKVILYYWADEENYWPEAEARVPDDPFGDPGGAERFLVNHQALAGAGVHVPEMVVWKPNLALVEDAGGVTLERLMEADPASAAEPLAALGAAMRRMHTTSVPHYGPLTWTTPPIRPAEDVILAGRSPTWARWPLRTLASPLRDIGSPTICSRCVGGSLPVRRTRWSMASSDPITY